MDLEGVNHRLTVVESAIEEIRDATRSIAESVQSIARLEERHAQTAQTLGRLFDDAKEVEKRVRVIEADMPGLREIRRWVVGGVLSITSIVGAAIIALVVVK